jgi:competence protein ComEA
MAERRRRPEPEVDRTALGVAGLFLVTSIGLFSREAWAPHVREGLLVEVTGDVAAPGLHVVDPPTLAAAVEAAGGLADDVPETVLVSGDAVRVDADGARVVRTSQPLLAALPVDLSHDGVDALAAVPGVGPKLAEAIVADRDAHGPYRTDRDLRRVPGLGRARLAEVRRYATPGETTPPPPVDVNHADADALATLPGIGPSLARRIVDDRAAHGAFASVDDLDRVSGIGPSTIARLAGRARVSP